MNATKNITSNTSAPKPVEKIVNVTKAVNITKNDTQVALKTEQKSKSQVKSSLHAAVQNMKKALQPTEEKEQFVVKKPEIKKFNRDLVGRSL